MIQINSTPMMQVNPDSNQSEKSDIANMTASLLSTAKIVSDAI